MTTDFRDPAALDRYAADVETALDDRAREHTMLWPLIGVWLVDGALLTLAVRRHSGVLFVLGLIVVVVWVAGVFLARPGRDWLRW
jgi:hypothetical protein